MRKTLLMISALACASASAQNMTTVATKLHSPRGLALDREGTLFVAEAGSAAGQGAFAPGIGFTASVTRIEEPASHPEVKRIITGLVSHGTAPDGVVGADGISVHGDGIYIIMAESTAGVLPDPTSNPAAAAQLGRLLKANRHGEWTVIADVGGFDYAWTALNKNQPWAPANQFPDANPYGVLARSGRQYVVDAGSNTVNEVRPDGSVRIIAYVPNPLFPATPGGPAVIPISDSVPTCVAHGRDGFLYVGTLAFGANFARFDNNSPPFWASLPPQSKVYRVDPTSSETFLTEADVWASGLNPITGCGFGPGGFYVTEFVTQTSMYNSGDIVRIEINPDHSAGPRTVFGAGVLINPNGFAAGGESIYVSNKSTSPTDGEVVRFHVGESDNEGDQPDSSEE